MKYLLIILILLLGCACRTQYVPMESVRTEYRDNINEIRVTDSVTKESLVYINGDTVTVYRYIDRWRTKAVRDSILILKTDTISKPYPVEKKLSVWQQTKMDYGGTAIIVMVITIVFSTVYLLRFCYLRRK
ncbi:MAG: hypothetical protein K2L11_08460 [Muribaculaceae bacterium]|nr:hypothetical protein [Muribaculaceae bacterium]